MQYIETIRIENGKPYNLAYHLHRMQSTCKHDLGLILEIPEQYAKGRIKCRVLYDRNKIHAISYIRYSLPNIKSLKVVEAPLIDYALKYADRSCLNDLMLYRDNCDDILICQNGSICDTSFGNVVFENKKGLFTPKTALLFGTKRQVLLDKGEIREKEITINELKEYDKIYLINAMIDIQDQVCINTNAILP